MTTRHSDFTLNAQGSIALLRPNTPGGEAWVNDNIGQESGYQPYWPTVVIETRFVENILAGIEEDGLIVGFKEL